MQFYLFILDMKISVKSLQEKGPRARWMVNGEPDTARIQVIRVIAWSKHQENDVTFKTEEHSGWWSASGLAFVRTAAQHNRTRTDHRTLIQATFHFTHSSDSESIGAQRWVIACQIDWLPQLRDSSSNRLAPTAGLLHVKSISAHSWVTVCQIG